MNSDAAAGSAKRAAKPPCPPPATYPSPEAVCQSVEFTAISASGGTQHALHITRQQVNFKIYATPGLQMLERRHGHGMRNQVDGEHGAIDGVGGEADAIDRD